MSTSEIRKKNFFPVTSDVSEDFPNTGNVTDKEKLSESENQWKIAFQKFSFRRNGMENEF